MTVDTVPNLVREALELEISNEQLILHTLRNRLASNRFRSLK